MYFLYSLAYTLAFALMLPGFVLRREKYASGFSERLGNYPNFRLDVRKVIWLHCVSVGETNAARPLAEALVEQCPDHQLVVSTTTRTGHELAEKIFAEKASAIFYFPFDWKFSVRRALDHFRPSVLLLMETEIWPRLIHEAKLSGAMVAIVNGRLSERSIRGYQKLGPYIKRVISDVDLALMQTPEDSERLSRLGLDGERIKTVGNRKFDQTASPGDSVLTNNFAERFRVSSDRPLIVAASTHAPEEKMVLDALLGQIGKSCRLLIAPRHPERFDEVQSLLEHRNLKFVRRSVQETSSDGDADVILLDSIGELRSAYPLAEIVFVGGSLIPHGGQSILEPAIEGKAIVTGPYTHNFESIVRTFLANDAIVQVPAEGLSDELRKLLENKQRRTVLGENAARVMSEYGGKATRKTMAALADLIRC